MVGRTVAVHDNVARGIAGRRLSIAGLGSLTSSFSRTHNDSVPKKTLLIKFPDVVLSKSPYRGKKVIVGRSRESLRGTGGARLACVSLVVKVMCPSQRKPKISTVEVRARRWWAENGKKKRVVGVADEGAERSEGGSC